MSWRIKITLAFLGLAVSLFVARFQRFPGYLDSDYYFSGGLQLVQGKGFTEPYLWNYLDDPEGLPHPSHTYWMPLASIVAAAGMWLTGQNTYAAGRLGFLMFAAMVPVATASLAQAISGRRDLALISGLLAVFSIYYLPFLPVTDNYAICMVLGALFFMTMRWKSRISYAVLGVIAGFLTLARSDGVLWLCLTGVLVLLRTRVRPHPTAGANARWREATTRMALACAGFALITGPWFVRTYGLFNTPLAPGGGRLLWLTNYDETFTYPAAQLTGNRWLEGGWEPIISARLGALKWNLLNAFAAQGGVFTLPFILIGGWAHRKDERVRVGALGWLLLLLVMTFLFPFAGARGGFFHAGASLQSLWWSLAPLGLDAAVAAARKRNLFTPQAQAVFRTALVGIAILMSAIIFALRVLPGWGEGEERYPQIEALLRQSGATPEDVVMVRNPPGYYLMTGRPAIVVPYAEAESIHAAAIRYQAKYMVLESLGAVGPIKSAYEGTDSTGFVYLGEIDGTRVFRVRP